MSRVTFRGLEMGWADLLPVMVESIVGVGGYSTNGEISWLPRNHQGVPAGGWVRSTDIVMELRIHSDRAHWRREIARAFTPDPQDPERLEELHLDLDAGEQWVALCRPIAREASRGQRTEIAGPLVRVVLDRPDPVLYGTVPKSAQLPPYVGVGFASYPADPSPADLAFGEYPKLYTGGGSGGGVQVDNDGTWPVWPRFVIGGPSSGTLNVERLENATTGSSVQFTADGGLQVPAGQTLVVDMHPARRIVRFVSGADRLNTVADLDSWWQITPGTQELRLRASGSTDGVDSRVEWRDGWL